MARRKWVTGKGWTDVLAGEEMISAAAARLESFPDGTEAIREEMWGMRAEIEQLRARCARMESHLRDVLPAEEVDRLLEGEG